jgi:hypothetical protein
MLSPGDQGQSLRKLRKVKTFVASRIHKEEKIKGNELNKVAW